LRIVIEFAPKIVVRDRLIEKKREVIQALEKALLERGFNDWDFSVYFTWEQ